MKITEKQYNVKLKQLEQIKTDLDKALELQAIAVDSGDLSENEEYHTAKAEAERLARERANLEQELAGAEIVSIDNGPRIGIGNTIDIYKVNSKSGERLSDTRRFVLEASGNTVLQGILGVNSALGRVVLNGTDGIYTIPNNGGISYHVQKIIEG